MVLQTAGGRQFTYGTPWPDAPTGEALIETWQLAAAAWNLECNTLEGKRLWETSQVKRRGVELVLGMHLRGFPIRRAN